LRILTLLIAEKAVSVAEKYPDRMTQIIIISSMTPLLPMIL